jgi:DNA-binding NtrC family response regulator
MRDRPGASTESVDSKRAHPTEDVHPVPGLVLVFALGQPRLGLLPFQAGQLELVRGDGASVVPYDGKMSRRHATVCFDGQVWHVADLGSHNGTLLDGVRISEPTSSARARVLRAGDCLFLLSADIRALRATGVQCKDDRVIGPATQAVLDQAGRAAQFGGTLHITGESGSGKEGIAHAFHDQSPLRSGPFVALNCATIAAGVAERLLFGAKRGAFSGAVADSDGLLHAADGGTLFLDEIGELDPAVQAKLLRVIETREVLPMGALKPRRVNLQLCSASHRDLRTEIASGRFREDLYYRIGRPEIVVPPLRQRLEEIPWLIDRALKGVAADLTASTPFVEACLLRHWPGNVRELLAEVRSAAQDALGCGVRRVEAQHLSPRAGIPIQHAAELPLGCALLLPAPLQKPAGSLERDRIEAALKKSGGNISAAARALGLHRTQLTRLMEKFGLSAGRGERELEQDTED